MDVADLVDSSSASISRFCAASLSWSFFTSPLAFSTSAAIFLASSLAPATSLSRALRSSLRAADATSRAALAFF